MTDVNQLITEHLDMWTSATEKKSSAGRGNGGAISLYGVKKLRELILELAVRGKLVAQDMSNVPADGLLNELQTQQARMFAEGHIKKPKPVAKIAAAEIPFGLPSGWKWCRISQLGHDWGQKVPDGTFTYIDVGSINKELGLIAEPTVLAASEAPSRARKLVRNGTVVYSTVRPYLLNIAVVTEDFDPEPIASTAFAVVHPFEGVLASYLYRYLRSPTFIAYVEGCQTGIAYPAINDKQFFSALVPLPPTAEQLRIVAKVDELMGLCDALEAQAKDSLQAHQTLVEACLATLTNSQTPEDLTQNWTRIEAHFDTLFMTEESVQSLRGTIMQLAVQGALICSESPVSSCVDQMRLELSQSQNFQEIKPGKRGKSMSGDLRLAHLPDRWQRIDLQDLAVQITDGTHLTPKYTADGSPFLSAKNVKPFQFLPDLHRFVSEDDFEGYRSNRRPVKGDLLLTRVGAGIGEAAVIDTDMEFAIYVSVCLIKPFNKYLNSDYLCLWLNSPEGRGLMTKKTYGRGASQGNLNLEFIRTLPVPVPPIDEQVEIVKVAKSFFGICTNLSGLIEKRNILSVNSADVLTSKIH